MKFLMTMFQIQDYGGIINHAEYLAKGLKELGHEVDFTMLVPKNKVGETALHQKTLINTVRSEQDIYTIKLGGGSVCQKCLTFLNITGIYLNRKPPNMMLFYGIFLYPL